MERTELKDILIACERVRRLAALLTVTKQDKKLVQTMLSMTANAEQTAIVRAGTFMANNIKKEVAAFFNQESIDCRDIMLTVLKKKEADSAVH